MEIKIVCGCGTKYKFDAEPIEGRMPWPVRCPGCGVEGTAQANEIIQAGPPAPVSIPTIPEPPALPAGPRLRVRTEDSAAPTGEIPGNPPPPHPAASSRPTTLAPLAGGRARTSAEPKALQKFGKIVLVVLCLITIVGATGYKWYKRVRLAGRVASVFGAKGGDAPTAEDNKNIWADNSVLLIIRHPSETEVAQACVDFWQERLKKSLSILTTNELFAEEGQLGVAPAYNGCVQIIGGLDWPKPQFEGLTEYLSQRFQTLAIEARDVSFSGAYLFGVFENGEKKFRAEMEIQGKTLADLDEVVKVENEAWAVEHGFKPGKEGFKEFHLGDADDITKRLGIKLENWQTSTNYLLLSESRSAPAPRGTNQPPAKRAATRRQGG